MINKYRALAIFNIIMGILMFISSQVMLWWVQYLGDVIDNIGLVVTTHFPASAQYQPSGRFGMLPLLNYSLIVFIIMVIGNIALLLLVRKSDNSSKA